MIKKTNLFSWWIQKSALFTAPFAPFRFILTNGSRQARKTGIGRIFLIFPMQLIDILSGVGLRPPTHGALHRRRIILVRAILANPFGLLCVTHILFICISKN